MSEFWKVVSLVLLTVILGLAVGKTERDISAVLAMVTACVVACALFSILAPVLDFLWELRAQCDLPEGLVAVLVKAVGIALTAELSGRVCADAGNASLGKLLQMLGGAVILSLSLPMFRTLMTILKEMIGSL